MRRSIAFDPDAALPWVSLAAAGAWFTGVALRRPAGDGDLLWQRWLGTTILREHAIPRALGVETFSAPGAPWTPHEWLFSVALAVSNAHGSSWLVPLACALAATVAVALVLLRCRQRGVSPVLAAAAPLVCVLATLQSFGVRAQVIGWAGLSATLWLLEREDAWAYAVIPLTAVWANLHASVFLAPLTAAIAALAIALRDRGWSPRLRRSMAIALGSAAATLATPLGVELPRYAAMLLASPIRQSISEWEPTSAASGAFLLGALPLLLALTSFGARAPLRDRIVAGTFIVALFGAVRNVPVFAIAVTPIVLGAVPPRLPDPRAGLSRAVFVMSTAAALLLAILAWRASPSIDPMPTDQARALLATASAPRVFCEDFAWCSLFLGTPGKARVFLDGRCDPYPAAVWRDYRTVLDGNERWSTVLAAHRVDAVLVRRDGALDSLLAGRTAWRAIAADRHTRLYLRSPVQPANVRPS